MQDYKIAARRSSWSGDKYIFYIPAKLKDSFTYIYYGLKRKDIDKNGIVEFVPHILIHTKDNKLGFYATTQCDMLADDWEVSK